MKLLYRNHVHTWQCGPKTWIAHICIVHLENANNLESSALVSFCFDQQCLLVNRSPLIPWMSETVVATVREKMAIDFQDCKKQDGMSSLFSVPFRVEHFVTRFLVQSGVRVHVATNRVFNNNIKHEYTSNGDTSKKQRWRNSAGKTFHR